MKTFLIVLAILILLGVVIFLLIRKPEKVIDDNSIVVPDSDSVLKPGSDYDTDKEEVYIPEHCKIDKCNEVLPNKYFFNVHKYTSKKGREMFCVVCSAIINNKNYRVIVKNSYYPYIGSYTTAIADRIRLMFKNDKMSVEDFMKLGSTNFVGVGDIVESLFKR